jgi:hypothetical protein
MLREEELGWWQLWQASHIRKRQKKMEGLDLNKGLSIATEWTERITRAIHPNSVFKYFTQNRS